MKPSEHLHERARAQGAPVEADVSALPPGALATVEWRGKPVWLRRRVPEMLSSLESIYSFVSQDRLAIGTEGRYGG